MDAGQQNIRLSVAELKPRDINCSFRMELNYCPTSKDGLATYNTLPSVGTLILLCKKTLILNFGLVRFKVLFFTDSVVILLAMIFNFYY